MTLSLSLVQARAYGIAAIVVVLALHGFNTAVCYKQDLAMFITGIGFFLLPPLLPTLIGLATRNPLRAVGAALFIIPWLVFAYYIDCIKPYAGGGASLAYVAVPLYGTPGAILGALITPWVCRRLGITIDDDANDAIDAESKA